MQTLDFKIVNGPLKILLQTVIDQLLSRQNINPKDDFSVLCELFLKTVDNNYDAVRCLVVKNIKFSTPASVICRSSLDLVFTFCLTTSRPEKYVSVYKKSGWREKYENLLHEQSSEWMINHQSDWLEKYARFLEQEAQIVGITQEERQNLKGIAYFPTPSQILQEKSIYYHNLSDSTKRLLKILMVEYYKPLSQLMHVSSPGLAMHIAPTLKQFPDAKKNILIGDPIYISWMCLLCLLSEINIYFRYQHANKLKELWTYLNLTIPLCDEIYKTRYQDVLI